ncbi:hypothetical protein BCR34DRAFT_88313 [Clohesyomyces aquaticus]|uniref:C2H2-type domain-containing protein n=1 Tax=Clohesyomyces aquaticus TaxID=1231657 RepID=A0A1Y1YWW8_9PLEO|nr:hypothetical protein BCR34DRAFT_88313 [Clohesyomyces aquaticus]
MNSAPNIAVGVANCGRGFLSLVEALESTPSYATQVNPETLSDEFDRFKVWAGNISAHRKGRRSLEYRLRDSENLKAETHSLLSALQEALDGARAIVSGERTPWDELSESESDASDTDSDEDRNRDVGDDTEFKQLHGNIKNITTCLFRLSMAIRDPAPNSQSRVKLTIDKSYFEAYDITHVTAKFPAAKKILLDRLGRAISARRKYLTYREEHCSKLAKGAEKIGHEEPTTEYTTNSTEASPVPNFQNASVIDDGEDTLSHTSYATSVNATIRVPPLPNEAKKYEPFECPLCFTIVSIHSTVAWKQHVYRDLHPYCCTFENCSTADRLWNSQHAWFKHELEAHRNSFRCFCEKSFNTQEEVAMHAKTTHPEVSSDMMSALIQTAARSASLLERATCPLCGKHMALRALKKHLGHHQEQLALFALPLSVATEDKPESEDSVSDFSDRQGDDENSDSNDSTENLDVDKFRSTIRRLRRAGGYGFLSEYRRLMRQATALAIPSSDTDVSWCRTLIELGEMWEGVTKTYISNHQLSSRDYTDLAKLRYLARTRPVNPGTWTILNQLVSSAPEAERKEIDKVEQQLRMTQSQTIQDDLLDRDSAAPHLKPRNDSSVIENAMNEVGTPRLRALGTQRLPDGKFDFSRLNEERLSQNASSSPESANKRGETSAAPAERGLSRLDHEEHYTRGPPPVPTPPVQPGGYPRPPAPSYVSEEINSTLDLAREPVDNLDDPKEPSSLNVRSSIGKEIPPDATWTKIDRRLVNPEALQEAKESWEERDDCLIVLRILTHDEIQKLADRTREIRLEREMGNGSRDLESQETHRNAQNSSSPADSARAVPPQDSVEPIMRPWLSADNQKGDERNLADDGEEEEEDFTNIRRHENVPAFNKPPSAERDEEFLSPENQVHRRAAETMQEILGGASQPHPLTSEEETTQEEHDILDSFKQFVAAEKLRMAEVQQTVARGPSMVKKGKAAVEESPPPRVPPISGDLLNPVKDVPAANLLAELEGDHKQDDGWGDMWGVSLHKPKKTESVSLPKLGDLGRVSRDSTPITPVPHDLAPILAKDEGKHAVERKALEEAKAKAAEPNKNGDEDKLAKLETLILDQKDECLNREATAEDARSSEKAEAQSRTAEEVAVEKGIDNALTTLKMAMAKIQEEKAATKRGFR